MTNTGDLFRYLEVVGEARPLEAVPATCISISGKRWPWQMPAWGPFMAPPDLWAAVNASHGMICARLMPFVFEANITALSWKKPDSPVLLRYRDVARMLTGSETATGKEAAPWLNSLCSFLEIPSLSQLGLTAAMLAELMEMACKSSSMAGNPIALTETELAGILHAAL